MPPLPAAKVGREAAAREGAAAANVYDLRELAGAFGDLGTLVPFVVGYVAVAKVDAAGILLTLGLAQVAAGLYYRTPIPVQPMKVIGGAAIASGGAVGAGAICAAGLFTGLFWLVAGATGAVGLVTRLAAKPVLRGIVVGLGLRFIAEGAALMWTAPWLGALGLALTFALLARPRIPPMFALLLLGAAATCLLDPVQARAVLGVRPALRLPELALGRLGWSELAQGAIVLAIPQLPLTLGNAILAVRAENNALFPHRPVTDRALAISQGLINLAAAPLGGIPLCHGAGGMAGHVRFGARTGGALVILGVLLAALGLFFGGSVELLFRLFPKAVLGVILFFAGAELALAARDLGREKEDVYVAVVVAGLATWNMGAAFLAGVILHPLLRRRWVRI
ncbi:MAG TPA: putative sulfate/molybdate transporter [Anaeromyxobacter sp.]|nr:putative sulfate/molybdate transporter [Anaeromyxobacter sp.]